MIYLYRQRVYVCAKPPVNHKQSPVCQSKAAYWWWAYNDPLYFYSLSSSSRLIIAYALCVCVCVLPNKQTRYLLHILISLNAQLHWRSIINHIQTRAIYLRALNCARAFTLLPVYRLHQTTKKNYRKNWLEINPDLGLCANISKPILQSIYILKWAIKPNNQQRVNKYVVQSIHIELCCKCCNFRIIRTAKFFGFEF